MAAVEEMAELLAARKENTAAIMATIDALKCLRDDLVRDLCDLDSCPIPKPEGFFVYSINFEGDDPDNVCRFPGSQITRIVVRPYIMPSTWAVTRVYADGKLFDRYGLKNQCPYSDAVAAMAFRRSKTRAGRALIKKIEAVVDQLDQAHYDMDLRRLW